MNKVKPEQAYRASERLQSLFTALNEMALPFVVLRNHQGLPEDWVMTLIFLSKQQVWRRRTAASSISGTDRPRAAIFRF